MLIHVIQNGNQVGPHSPEQFDDLLQKGLLSGDDLYWHEGCDGWSPVSLHPDFPRPVVLSAPPPQPPPLAGVRRVGQQASTLKVCRDCGHAVSPSAKSCPNCGKRLRLGCLPKLAIGFGGLVIVYIILLILFPPRGRTAGPTAAPPKVEAAFIAKVQSYVARYAAASNELQKTAVRTERARGLAQVVTDMQVSGWVGTLKKLETTRDGQASIAIQLDGTPIKVCTAPGLLGPDSSTLIEPNSPLYVQLSSMAVGQEVRFSGSFLPDEHDHIKETSLTEEGAMTEPGFVMRFSNVTVAQAGSSSVAPALAPATVLSGSPPAALSSPVPPVAPGRAQTAPALVPEAQTSFIDTVDSYISRYTAASNELQKSAVRTQRRAALARTITDMHVSGWIGTLKKLATSPRGDASIMIRLEGSAISVHTDFRNPFDQGSNTLIEHSSALYNKLASLSVGDRVVFSGSFQPGETDHLQETSFPESGSMTAPEFVMRFSDVTVAPAALSVRPNTTAEPLTADESPSKQEAAFTPAPLASSLAMGTPPMQASDPSPAASASPAPTAPSFPRAIVADFYEWYLQEIWHGRPPWLNGELAKRPEISHGFATRIENAKEPEPEDDPIFAAQEVPGSFAVEADRVNGFDATVAVRLAFGLDRRLVNVRLVRNDQGEPWKIDDVQPVLVGASATPTTGSIVADAAPAASPSPDVGVSERLLIGKWQGARHLTEYRADHTRVMDGMSINPPRSWHLEGDRLSEEPGKNFYKVVALDQNQLVLEGDGGKLYSHQRVLSPAVTGTASQALSNQDDVSAPSATGAGPTPATAASNTNLGINVSGQFVLYKGSKIPWQLPLPGYWHLIKQPVDANADASWEGPQGIVLTAYSLDENDLGDFWNVLKKVGRITQIDGPPLGQKPPRGSQPFLSYGTVAETIGGLELRFVTVSRMAERSDRLLVFSGRLPPGLPQRVVEAVAFDVGFFYGYASRSVKTTGRVDMQKLHGWTTKDDALLVELAKPVHTQEVASTAAVAPVPLNKAQWKDKMARNFRYFPGTPVIGSAQHFQQVMGKPDRTETVGDQAYWYYQCSDGTIQLVMNVLNLQMAGLIQADVNDY